MSPPTVEILFGASALKCSTMALLEIFSGQFEPLIDVFDPAIGFLCEMALDVGRVPARRGKKQLGLGNRPSCKLLFAFCLADYTARGSFELFRAAHRS